MMKWMVFFGCLNFIACTTVPEQQAMLPSDHKGMVLLFSEIREGGKETPMRMLINANFLRIDQGPESRRYTLFDRRKKVIYQVAEDQSMQVIKNQLVTIQPPQAIQWQIESQPSSALMRMPNVAQATHRKLSLNGQACYNTIVVDGLLNDGLAILREYYGVLAGELSHSYESDGTSDALCWSAVNIFTPLQRFNAGFPMREWGAGYQRFLMDYRLQVEIPEHMFTRPKD